MADPRETDIHGPDGTFFRGEKVGHGDGKTHIRVRDGILFRGDEIGYVDEHQRIRRPDGILLRGEQVGQVKGNAAHDNDGILLSGEQWGYVDEAGNVRQRDGVLFRGRIIGKMRGHSKEAALGYFVLRFKRLEDRFEELARDVTKAEDKSIFLDKVRHMLEYVPGAEALGDFDGLIGRLHALEREILAAQQGNQSRKERLCAQAETLSHSDDWKATAEALRALQTEWKRIGSSGREQDPALWDRFRRAQDTFYQRRTRFFEERDRERAKNRAIKEGLCARAESLSASTEWKQTGDALKGLQGQWKHTGPAGKDHDEVLWQRFRSALDRFYDRRTQFFHEREQEQSDNLRRKERLCAEAESLCHASDTRSAVGQVKDLQEQWKSIGHVPRERADEVWARFRQACDVVFSRARDERERRESEQLENLHRKERLCAEADSLGHAGDTRAAADRVKELQHQWKEIGHVPRERADDLWSRFREACDVVFARAREERERKQAEWRHKMEEALARKEEQADRLRESILHDEANVSRWQEKIYDLRPGGRAAEIKYDLESRISDVSEKIRSKHDRLADLESAIRDIRSRLA